jgi:ankyrin repeat protein
MAQVAFQHASEAADPEMAEQLLEQALGQISEGLQLREGRFPSGLTPALTVIAHSTEPEVTAALIRKLAERGADLEARVREWYLAAHHVGCTPLQLALALENLNAALQEVGTMLRAGASPNSLVAGPSRATTLIWAADGRAALVTCLLAAGADVHARDARGLTGLHCAVGQHNVYGEGDQLSPRPSWQQGQTRWLPAPAA